MKQGEYNSVHKVYRNNEKIIVPLHSQIQEKEAPKHLQYLSEPIVSSNPQLVLLPDTNKELIISEK